MTVNSGRFGFVAVCLLVSFTQVPEAMAQTQETLSPQCLQCICEAASGCDTLTGCKDDVCGPYRITRPYWCDSGRLGSDSNSPDGGFESCVGDRSCAARVVQGYMTRYARDCNGDGVVNCDDYALMHRLGVVGCSGASPPDYLNAYSNCMSGGSSGSGGSSMQPVGNALPVGNSQPGGYAQQPAGYMQQPGGYAQQPAGHMQQPGGYAQQPARHMQQPGGYAQQPAGGHSCK